MENVQGYVVRKLKESHINLNALAKELKISRSTLYSILNGGETSFTKIDRLNNFFRKAGD